MVWNLMKNFRIQKIAPKSNKYIPVIFLLSFCDPTLSSLPYLPSLEFYIAIP